MESRPIYFVKEDRMTSEEEEEEAQLKEARRLMNIFTEYASDVNNYALSEESLYVA